MALKKASGKLEVLEVEGSKVYGIRPTKAVWDEYVDEMFQSRTERAKMSKALPVLYRNCLKKLEDVEVGVDESGKPLVGTITSPDEIVSFMAGLESAEAGRKIDTWLLGLGGLLKDEEKNSDGASKQAS